MSQLISNEVGRGYLPSSWSWPEQSSFFPLPHHVQIKDNLLDCGPCPTRKSFLCLWKLMLEWSFLPQPLQTWPMCCQIMCWLCIGKGIKSLSHTLQGWTLFLSVSHGWLSQLQKANPQDLQVYDDGKCLKLSPIKKKGSSFKSCIAEHEAGSLCISTMWLFNFLLAEITL